MIYSDSIPPFYLFGDVEEPRSQSKRDIWKAKVIITAGEESVPFGLSTVGRNIHIGF